RFRSDSLIDDSFSRSRTSNLFREGVSLPSGDGGKRIPAGSPLPHSMGSSVSFQLALTPPQISSQHLAREKAAQRTSGVSSGSSSYKLLVPTDQGSSGGVPFALPKLGPSPTPPSGVSSGTSMAQHSGHQPNTSSTSIGVGTSSLRDDDAGRSGGGSSRDSRTERDRDNRKRDRESRDRDLLIEHRDETDKAFASSQGETHGGSVTDDGTWPCAVCTFLNEPSVNICAMCSKSRHLHSRPPADEP
ncbi:hypothetical protein BIW11_10959, partial [Tropilaelaps mercedesae]